jgi:hypothetical protein
MEKKPCKDCPFRRNNGSLGGSEATVYIGQAIGPFLLPCHSQKGYKGKETVLEEAIQCTGAAIFRNNIDVAKRMPDKILSLPKNTEDVFETKQEFLAHYTNLPIEHINIIPENFYEWLLAKELMDVDVRDVNI